MNARQFDSVRALGTILFALALASPARAALLAYEPYDYPEGADLSGQAGGTGWTATPWTATTGDTVIAFPGGLTYSDSLGNTLNVAGNAGYYTGAPGTASTFRDLPAVRGADGTTTWFSVLGIRAGQRSGNPPTFQRAANISLFNGTLAASPEQLAIGEGTNRAEDTWSLVPDGSAGNTVASTLAFDELALVVLRIDHLAGNDNVYMFLNPDLNAEPSIASAAAVSLGAFDYSFNRVRPFAGNPQVVSGVQHNPGEIYFDEIRIGESFGDVTPHTPFIPEPSTWALVVLAAAGAMVWRRRRG
jgi:hypothetical protein